MAAVPDEALVVRGGDPHDPERLKGMAEQAERAYKLGLGYSLSVYVGHDPALGRDDAIKRITAVRPIPNRKIAVTTAARLTAINCVLIPDGPLPCHARAVLGSEPDPGRVQDFIGAFGPAEDNPASWRRQPGGDSDPH
jgi:hypothetical protein